jgi:peptide/nickel transport system substrate-binding protein
VGSGRFRFSKLETGVRAEIVADTTHFLGRPKLDRVVWALNADAGAAITQLMAGQADMYENLPPAVLASLDSSKSVRAMKYPGLQYAFLGMNTRNPKRLAEPHPIFSDARVRRAIFMALDRQGMLRNVFDTVGVLGSGPYPRALSDSTITLPPFDRSRSAALLDSAGWTMGPNGVRQKNGKPLAFALVVPTSSTFRMRYAVLIQEQLKSIGAVVTLEPLEFNAFFARQDARSFDANLGSSGVDPSRATITQSWTKVGAEKGGQNYLSYTNPLVDALIDTALTTFDEQRARDYYHRAVQMIVDDAPAVWLYDVLTIAGVHKRLRPAPMRADAWWANLADWSIPANERIDRDRIGLRPAAP